MRPTAAKRLKLETVAIGSLLWLLWLLWLLTIRVGPARADEVQAATAAPKAVEVSASPVESQPSCEKALVDLLRELAWKSPGTRPPLRGPEFWTQFAAKNPAVKGGNLDKFFEWFAGSNEHHFDGPFMQVHLSDWFKSMGISTFADIGDLQQLWPSLTGEQRTKAIEKLVEAIDKSKLTSVFSGDVSQWGGEIKFLRGLGLSPDAIQQFNARWAELTPNERKAFFLVTVSDDLPGALETFVPLVKQGDQLAFVAPVKKTAVRLGTFAMGTVQVDERLAKYVSQLSHMADREVAERAIAMPGQLSSVSFDEIAYFVNNWPAKKMKGWRVASHIFESVDEKLAISDASSFSHVDTVVQDGRNVQVGRGSVVFDVADNLVKKLEKPPTQEQYLQMLKWFDNAREQGELRFQLHKRFPGSY